MSGVPKVQRLLSIGRWGAVGLVAVAWMWGFVWLVWQIPPDVGLQSHTFHPHLDHAIEAAMGVVGNRVYLQGGMAAALAGLAMAIRMVYPRGDRAFALAMKQRFTDQARPIPARVRAPWVKVLPLTVPILTAFVLVTMGTGGGLFLLLMSAAMLLSYRMELAAGLMFGICAWIWPMGGGVLLLWLLAIHRRWLASAGLAAAWESLSGMLDGFASLSGAVDVELLHAGLHPKAELLFWANAGVVLAVLSGVATWMVISFRPIAGIGTDYAGRLGRWFMPRPFIVRPGEQQSQGVMRELGLLLACAAALESTTETMAAMGVVAIVVGCREHDIAYRRGAILEHFTYGLAALGGLVLTLHVLLFASILGGIQLKFALPAMVLMLAVFAAFAHRWRPKPATVTKALPKETQQAPEIPGACMAFGWVARTRT